VFDVVLRRGVGKVLENVFVVVSEGTQALLWLLLLLSTDVGFGATWWWCVGGEGGGGCECSTV
jgi:hypothetical protein